MACPYFFMGSAPSALGIRVFMVGALMFANCVPKPIPQGLPITDTQGVPVQIKGPGDGPPAAEALSLFTSTSSWQEGAEGNSPAAVKVLSPFTNAPPALAGRHRGQCNYSLTAVKALFSKGGGWPAGERPSCKLMCACVLGLCAFRRGGLGGNAPVRGV